jgi:hypothetical protein
MTNPGLRASDEDRQRVVEALERHTAAGRLTLDEFGDRVAKVFGAVTHHDLGRILEDLPPAAEEDGTDGHSRQLLVAFAIAVVTLVVLAVVIGIWH